MADVDEAPGERGAELLREQGRQARRPRARQGADQRVPLGAGQQLRERLLEGVAQRQGGAQVAPRAAGREVAVRPHRQVERLRAGARWQPGRQRPLLAGHGLRGAPDGDHRREGAGGPGEVQRVEPFEGRGGRLGQRRADPQVDLQALGPQRGQRGPHRGRRELPLVEGVAAQLHPLHSRGRETADDGRGVGRGAPPPAVGHHRAREPLRAAVLDERAQLVHQQRRLPARDVQRGPHGATPGDLVDHRAEALQPCARRPVRPARRVAVRTGQVAVIGDDQHQRVEPERRQPEPGLRRALAHAHAPSSRSQA